MKSSYSGVAVPGSGKAIEYSGGAFHVPDQPVIPFIEGDGTGRDIWKASRLVFDAAVAKAYGAKRKVAWLEVFAGEKRTTNSRNGCLPIPLRRFETSAWRSRGRSLLLWAAEYARST